MFSIAKKELLMKAVLQAILTYIMSCYKLPLSLCHEINSIIADFWWESSMDDKKIHRVSWNKLCALKGLGGLGFRNFEDFNQAMWQR